MINAQLSKPALLASFNAMMVHALSLNSLAQPHLALSILATNVLMVSVSPTSNSALMPPLAALIMLQPNAVMVHANYQRIPVAQPQFALPAKLSA